jgi:hypothetical protein
MFDVDGLLRCVKALTVSAFALEEVFEGFFDVVAAVGVEGGPLGHGVWRGDCDARGEPRFDFGEFLRAGTLPIVR